MSVKKFPVGIVLSEEAKIMLVKISKDEMRSQSTTIEMLIKTRYNELYNKTKRSK